MATQVDLQGNEVPVIVDHEEVVTHKFEADHFKVNVTAKRQREWSDLTKESLRSEIEEEMRPLKHVRALRPDVVALDVEALTDRIYMFLANGEW